MKAIRTNESNDTYSGKLVGPHCADLPCVIDPEKMQATYVFTEAERRLIANGGMLTLTIWGHPMPPVALDVRGDEVQEQWDAKDMVCANEDCAAVWREDRQATECGHCGGPIRPALVP